MNRRITCAASACSVGRVGGRSGSAGAPRRASAAAAPAPRARTGRPAPAPGRAGRARPSHSSSAASWSRRSSSSSRETDGPEDVRDRRRVAGDVLLGGQPLEQRGDRRVRPPPAAAGQHLLDLADGPRPAVPQDLQDLPLRIAQPRLIPHDRSDPLAPGRHATITRDMGRAERHVPFTEARRKPPDPAAHAAVPTTSDRRSARGAQSISSAPSPASAEAYLQLVVGRLLQAVEGFKGGFGRIGKIFLGTPRTMIGWLARVRGSLPVEEGERGRAGEYVRPAAPASSQAMASSSGVHGLTQQIERTSGNRATWSWRCFRTWSSSDVTRSFGHQGGLDQPAILVDDRGEYLVGLDAGDALLQREMGGDFDEFDPLPGDHGRLPSACETGLVLVPFRLDRLGHRHAMTCWSTACEELAAIAGRRMHRHISRRPGDRGVDDQHPRSDLGHADHPFASRSSAADR